MNQFEPLSEQEIRRSIWYVDHAKQLRRGVIISLCVLDALLVIPSLIMLGLTLSQWNDDQRIRDELVAVPLEHTSEAASPLVVGAAATVLQKDTMDIVIEVENSNPEFAADVSYAFDSPTGVLGPYHDIIPAQTRTHLIALHMPRVSGEAAALRPLVVHWRRANAHRDGRTEEFLQRVGSIRITGISSDTGVGSGQVGVQFTVTNGTAFHLQSIPLVVLLERANSIVGVNRVVIERVPSGSSRVVQARWVEAPNSFQTITVEPHLDLLDASNRYIP